MNTRPLSRTLAASLLAMTAVIVSGCTTNAPEPGKVVAQERFEQLVVPGRTTRAELLAAFGPTRSVVFDSGFEAWLYESMVSGGRHAELVLLLDRAGIVRKMRTRPPYPGDPQR
jgi:hypothetical protein